MDNMTIATLLTLPANTPVPSTSGIVGFVGDRKAGKNAKGDWSVQHIELLDGDARIKVSVWGAAEIPRTWKGQKALVLAGNRTDGKGICGCKIKLDNYTNKDGKEVEQKVIDVSDKGAFVLATTGDQTPAPPPASQPVPAQLSQPSAPSAANPPAASAPMAPPVQPPVSQPSPASTGQRKADPTATVIEAKEFLARAGNLMVMAAEEALQVLETFMRRNAVAFGRSPEQAFTANDKASVASAIMEQLSGTAFTTLFIEAGRKTELVRSMPKGELTKFTEAAKERAKLVKSEEAQKAEAEKAAKKAKAAELAEAAKKAAEEAARLAAEAGAE